MENRPTGQQILAEIRAYRALQWKREYCRKNGLYRRGMYSSQEDIRAAPEPKDHDIGFPINTLTVEWGSGYLTIELAALMKLPAAQRNKIYKLGGLH